jgi:hypothetical protein
MVDRERDGHVAPHPVMYKLKDWPPSDDIREKLCRHYAVSALALHGGGVSTGHLEIVGLQARCQLCIPALQAPPTTIITLMFVTPCNTEKAAAAFCCMGGEDGPHLPCLRLQTPNLQKLTFLAPLPQFDVANRTFWQPCP